ncbi:hypothetical protein F4778DRAFT_732691 [Xylariomycetidae sp. FL2044]|nr:hypothetical protein F4778DRAFT_732691 [Xylariomycetidae sp. FL2044]
METVSAGASVIAFIGFAAQLAKSTYTTFSTIKDGPRIVSDTANTLLQLYWILEKWKQTRTAINDDALLGHLRLCKDEITAAAAAIERLQFASNDNKSVRLWKKLKVFLKEDELKRLHKNIVMMCSLLSVRLGYVSSDVLSKVKDNTDTMMASIETVAADARNHETLRNTQIADMSTKLDESTSLINDQLVLIDGRSVAIQSYMKADSDARTALMLRHHTETSQGLDALAKSVRDRDAAQSTQFNDLTTQFSGIQDLIQSGVSSLQANISRTTSLSDEKGDEMLELLRNLTLAVSTHSSRDNVIAPLAPKSEYPDPNGEAIESIRQLSKLIDQKPRTINTYAEDDVESETIIQSLQSLLQAAQKIQPVLPPFRLCDECSHRRLWDRLEKDCESCLELGNSQLTTVSRRFTTALRQSKLTLNAQGTTRNIPQGTVLSQECSHVSVKLENGTLRLFHSKRHRSNQPIDRYTVDDNYQYTDHVTRVTFVPGSPGDWPMLVATAFQHEVFPGAVSSISTLALNRTVERDSPVFQAIKRGELQEFRQMLQDGEASLRDHDPNGGSLLHYAAINEHPEICKYLIDHGLDIDHVANGQTALDLVADGFVREKKRPERKRDRDQVRRILLTAGADPTINTDRGDTFVERVLEFGSADSIRLIWQSDFTHYVTPLKHYRSPLEDLPPLLLFLGGFLGGIGFDEHEKVNTLIDLGADVHCRAPNGKTCLHYYVVRMLSSHLHISERINIMQTLLIRGADPRSVDYYGVSVSCDIYSWDRTVRSSSKGSMDVDIWDSVLQRCGYDIKEFRCKHHPREALYGKDYTREMFESLWKGQEQDCPYWDDEPWIGTANCACNKLCRAPTVWDDPVWDDSESEGSAESDGGAPLALDNDDDDDDDDDENYGDED